MIVQKLEANKTFLQLWLLIPEENTSKLCGVPIDGVQPTGKYEAACPIFIYVKKQHIGVGLASASSSPSRRRKRS